MSLEIWKMTFKLNVVKHIPLKINYIVVFEIIYEEQNYQNYNNIILNIGY